MVIIEYIQYSYTEIGTARCAGITIMKSAVNAEVITHRIAEPLRRTNIEAFLAVDIKLPTIIQLKTSRYFGNNTTSMKEESTIITGKHTNVNPICHKGIKTIFILPISILKMGKNLHTAVRSCTKATDLQPEIL